jgi:SAM-dependent methyltransferase
LVIGASFCSNTLINKAKLSTPEFAEDMRRDFLRNTLGTAAAINLAALSSHASLIGTASLLSLGSLVSTGCNFTGAPVPRSPITQDLDVPFVTTPDNVVLKILEMAGVSDLDFLLDLGSGDGRIPITAALKRGARGLGVEIDPQLVWRSKENAKAAKVDHLVDFKIQDLFETDLSQATVITMYLLPDVNLKLRPALQKLKPGTRIVSHDWDMGDWPATRTEKVAAPDKKVGLIKESKIMLWVVQ